MTQTVLAVLAVLADTMSSSITALSALSLVYSTLAMTPNDYNHKCNTVEVAHLVGESEGWESAHFIVRHSLTAVGALDAL